VHFTEVNKQENRTVAHIPRDALIILTQMGRTIHGATFLPLIYSVNLSSRIFSWWLRSRPMHVLSNRVCYSRLRSFKVVQLALTFYGATLYCSSLHLMAF